LTHPSAKAPRGWRYGIHPAATGATVRSLGRVDLPLGEALRIELVGPDPATGDTTHLQYYIATEYGGWALWISCAKGQETEVEATLATLVPQLM
jgi:hypothetical protein